MKEHFCVAVWRGEVVCTRRMLPGEAPYRYAVVHVGKWGSVWATFTWTPEQARLAKREWRQAAPEKYVVSVIMTDRFYGTGEPWPPRPRDGREDGSTSHA
jgi:hypothetical protein